MLNNKKHWSRSVKQCKVKILIVAILVILHSLPTLYATAQEEIAQEETVQEETAQDDAAQDDAVQDDTVQDDTAQDDAAQDDTVQEDIEEVYFDVSAQAVILMETTTGEVIYEENADLQLAPASVTKIMTLLLIFDALEEGKITLEDSVSVSEYAASMGGSQIYLEVGEVQSVETMIKAITVSSANDACVAMAEYISGTAEAFVIEMNERAEGLGMTNTNFVNCNGLDVDGHLTTARDIALMSQEIMTKYPEIQDYTMIWMEDITHVTSKGESVFGLSNTNRLVQAYEYTTGLKTGSTDEALFCISATATKEDVDLIAVIMAAPTSADRTRDAINLLNYGFSVTQKYEDVDESIYDDIPIIDGIYEVAQAQTEEIFAYVDVEGNDLSQIEKRITYEEGLTAPIEEGQTLGIVEYYINGSQIGSVALVATEAVEKMNYKYALTTLIPQFLL